VPGGTGQIGVAVAQDLVGAGWRVTLASRRGGGIVSDGGPARSVALDARAPGALRAALGDGVDALIHCVAYSGEDAKVLLAVEGQVGATVAISSSSVYCDTRGRTLDEAASTGFPTFDGPIRETNSIVPPGPQTYSTRKAELERVLLDGAKRPATILRPCAIYGPHSSHPRELWFVKRMVDGRERIPLAYGGRSVFHTSSVANVAALIRLALEKPGTRVLNAADPVALNVRALGAAIAEHLGYDGVLHPIESGAAFPPRIGRTPWSTPAPFTLDLSGAAALGHRPVAGYETASRGICDWLRADRDAACRMNFPVLAAYGYNLFDYAAEDAFFEHGILK